MKNKTTRIMLILMLVAIPDILSAQQFEIRYNNTVLNDGDTVVYIPSEQEIQNDYCKIYFQICNTTNSNIAFTTYWDWYGYGIGGTYECTIRNYSGNAGVLWGVSHLPWQSLVCPICPNDGLELGVGIYPSGLTYPPEGFLDITIWDTNDISTMKTIRLYTYDTNIYPIDVHPFISPSLCMVSVQDGHNTLIWNDEGVVVEYKLFREGNVSGEYEQIATIPYNSVLMWVDSSSRPTTRSYRYRISAVNLNGMESELSSVHKTMHLSINQGLGGRWNLQWTPYEGADYTTYIIYRGINATDLEQIDIMPADGNTSYTDETAPQGDVYYQVGIVMSTPCSDSNTKSNSISLSNIATNSAVGIISVDEGNIIVYARDGYIFVKGADKESISVFDMFGRNIGDYSHVLSNGIYMVKIGNHLARKVVVIR